MVRALVRVATACHALLAGVGVDRMLVQMPAWRRTGTDDWAAYSRNADLAPGAALYPSAAFVGATCTIAAAALAEPDERAPLLIASAFAVLGLLATGGAAPNMLRLRDGSVDRVTLERSFRGFHRWGNVRAVLQSGALAANVWALSAR
jgi:hypothetical protein